MGNAGGQQADRQQLFLLPEKDLGLFLFCIQLLAYGNIGKDCDLYPAILRMIEYRHVGPAPERSAVFFDIVDLSLPAALFFQVLHDLEGSLLRTDVRGGIDDGDMLADQFAGLIAEHLFKFPVGKDNNPIVVPHQQHALGHIGHDLALQAQFLFRLFVFSDILAD